jgi:hypothetical protein
MQAKGRPEIRDTLAVKSARVVSDDDRIGLRL